MEQIPGNLDHYVYVEHCSDFSQLYYLQGLDKLVKGNNIIQLTRMNGYCRHQLKKLGIDKLCDQGNNQCRGLYYVETMPSWVTWTGLASTITGAHNFEVMKGAVDTGFDISHSNSSIHKKQFAKYITKGIGHKNIEVMHKTMHVKIWANPKHVNVPKNVPEDEASKDTVGKKPKR
ncbi:RpL5 [Cordylochernes scorpioides]|uniref:RpL5 n=1 Tax=Cordylochernes scorpioides TaxID=51811 RepID=A0ABY6LSX4_9ARAC|nr:RpL5 [Cordylochernes scorpioides]